MDIKQKNLSFSDALSAVKNGEKITREGWNNPNIWVEIQIPDGRSKMTKPYLFMVKGDDKFPLDLSCESILGEDWMTIR